MDATVYLARKHTLILAGNNKEGGPQIIGIGRNMSLLELF